MAIASRLAKLHCKQVNFGLCYNNLIIIRTIITIIILNYASWGLQAIFKENMVNIDVSSASIIQ